MQQDPQVFHPLSPVMREGQEGGIRAVRSPPPEPSALKGDDMLTQH
jgi:hypothetical protein